MKILSYCVGSQIICSEITQIFSVMPLCEEQMIDDPHVQGQRSELSQEIGEYGTGMDSLQQDDADSTYEATFMDDPGHVSRAGHLLPSLLCALFITCLNA